MVGGGNWSNHKHAAPELGIRQFRVLCQNPQVGTITTNSRIGKTILLELQEENGDRTTLVGRNSTYSRRNSLQEMHPLQQIVP
jgi:hypothetical protein